jgi:hypothetical protein
MPRPPGPHPAAFAPCKPRSVVVRAQAASSDAEGTSRRAVLGASVALSAAAGVLPQLALPRPAAANTILSADWEQVRVRRRCERAAVIPADRDCWGIGHGLWPAAGG